MKPLAIGASAHAGSSERAVERDAAGRANRGQAFLEMNGLVIDDRRRARREPPARAAVSGRPAAGMAADPVAMFCPRADPAMSTTMAKAHEATVLHTRSGNHTLVSICVKQDIRALQGDEIAKRNAENR